MNGPSEFHVIGTLRDWSVVEDVARIEVPTLLISGRHDEATPATIQPFYDRIPNVRWEIFEDSSHVPHIEEPARFKSAHHRQAVPRRCRQSPARPAAMIA